MSAPQRLQKYLASCGVCSRRQGERIIAAGRVSVNGEVENNPARKVTPGEDRVEVDEKQVTPQLFRYILLNKPQGVLCTTRDTRGRETIYSRLPPEFSTLPYVGRLDVNTEGVLLLTNDGDLTFRLTRPEYGILREYRVKVRGRVEGGALAKLTAGILDDGEALIAAKAEITRRLSSNTLVSLVLTEGKNREVRRMVRAIGHHVITLTRTRFAGLSCRGLEPGEWRELTPVEVEALRNSTMSS